MFLDEAVEAARRDLKTRREAIHIDLMEELAEQKPLPSSFKDAIKRGAGEPVNIIAEIKRSSPSRGFIKNGFSVEDVVRNYTAGGAAAISVLTEGTYFKGSLLDLSSAATVSQVPLLRKDFIVDPYQVLESRYMGASALLLIVAALPGDSLKELAHARSQRSHDSEDAPCVLSLWPLEFPVLLGS